MREMPGGQQGDKWMEHRCGRPTASRMNDVVAYSKTGLKKNPPEFNELEARIKYRYELLAERMTGREQRNRPPTQAMEWGSMMEDQAKQVFEMATGQMIIPVGFVLHPTIDCTGASADGILDDAILEVKCPETTTFLRWKLSPGVPEEHQLQMLWEMACCEREKGIFLAYDPRIKDENNRFFYRELARDNERIAWLESEVLKFDGEIEALLAELGLPPTVWNTKGDEEIHVPEQQWPADLTSDAYDFIDEINVTP